jgi:hypothetical protein
MIPTADALIEDVYDFVFKRCPEAHRIDVARAALLAAQYRAQMLAQKRTQRAIERVAAERRALKDSTGASRDTQPRAALTSASGAVAPENTPAG